MQRLIKIRRSSKQATVGDVRQGLRLLAVLLIGVPLLLSVVKGPTTRRRGIYLIECSTILDDHGVGRLFRYHFR